MSGTAIIIICFGVLFLVLASLSRRLRRIESAIGALNLWHATVANLNPTPQEIAKAAARLNEDEAEAFFTGIGS